MDSNPQMEETTEVQSFGYIPRVDEFSEELIEAMDPDNGIEEEYMPYNSSVVMDSLAHV